MKWIWIILILCYSSWLIYDYFLPSQSCIYVSKNGESGYSSDCDTYYEEPPNAVICFHYIRHNIIPPSNIDCSQYY